jgi:diguanylate cyclase (GGDEF)-like protein/PAS domain S-box-containing protein
MLQQTCHGGVFETEQQLYTVDGSQIWCQIRGKQLTPSEADFSMVWSIDDISEKKQLMDELRLAATVYQVTGEAIMIMDTQHQVISVNPAFSEMTGFIADDVMDQPTNCLFEINQTNDTYQQILTKLRVSGQWKGEQLIKRKNSDAFTALLIIDTVYRDDGSISHYVAVFSDFTERKKLEVELRYQAENDPLTKLPNRTLFFHRLQLALAGAKRYQYSVALLYIDLDGFKLINDNFGHGRGDMVLVDVANRLRKEIREVDTIARIGGDEFVVILNGTSDFLIETTVQRVLDALELSVEENHQLFHITASIGIALYPEHCQDANKLLQYADQAMYRAKHIGKRTYCWHEQ